MQTQRIYITGAAGAGVSTLGRELARAINSRFVDVDDYYWLETDPPFTQRRAPEERVCLLKSALDCERWVLSGSLDGWGDELVVEMDQVFFLETPTEIRLKRIAEREFRRFGDRISPKGDMYEQYQAFLQWAGAYEESTMGGRSRQRHERWLQQLPVPVKRLDGTRPVDQLVGEALQDLSL